MKKKIIAAWIVCAFVVNPLSFSFAKNEFVEWRAYNMALQYIENSLEDEAWKDNNPHITNQKKFYTDSDKEVSYYRI